MPSICLINTAENRGVVCLVAQAVGQIGADLWGVSAARCSAGRGKAAGLAMQGLSMLGLGQGVGVSRGAGS